MCKNVYDIRKQYVSCKSMNMKIFLWVLKRKKNQFSHCWGWEGRSVKCLFCFNLHPFVVVVGLLNIVSDNKMRSRSMIDIMLKE